MTVTKEFTVFALVDRQGNTAMCVADKLTDLVNIYGLYNGDNQVFFFNKAENIFYWASSYGFTCAVTKRVISVDIAV